MEATLFTEWMFILLAGDQELLVEIGDILRFWHRHPVVAPKVSGFSFNAALLMSSAGLQNSASNRQCDKATNRAVCSRRDPRIAADPPPFR